MDFRKLHEQLVAKGYNDDTADAKIAHDIVLKAIDAAGFRDNLTVKGGVVMSGITDLVRLAADQPQGADLRRKAQKPPADRPGFNAL